MWRNMHIRLDKNVTRMAEAFGKRVEITILPRHIHMTVCQPGSDDFLLQFLKDAGLAAIAAIGFGVIQPDSPKGIPVVWADSRARSLLAAEAYLFPSLLPMIPGIYAYKAFGGAVLCLFGDNQDAFEHNFYLFASNGFICLAIIFAMTIGAILPIFTFKSTAFTATR